MAKSRIVDLNEWQQWRQEYPRQYWLLKQYIIGAARHSSSGHDAINPREWFTTGQMLGFLTMHRDLFASEHIRFTETTFAGKPAVVIGISLQGVKTCENYWSAVKQVLSVLSSKNSE